MKNLCGFVFPGQGSQSVGMLMDIARNYPELEACYTTANQVLGYDLWKIVQQGPATDLDNTVHTQPALLVAGVAMWRICKTKLPENPALLAGHSLGEYTALVCGEALAFEDAIKLVSARGQYMQDAVGPGQGALVAIVGLDDATIYSICEQAAQGEVLAPANFNCPGQVVVAGQVTAVHRAMKLAEAAQARLVKLLPVSVPSHCALMKPAAERLAKLLETIAVHRPKIPVVNNVAAKIENDPGAIRANLVKQLYSPVRWVETIQAFTQAGINQVIECGPGKVLTGLNKRINGELQLASTADMNSLTAAFELLQGQIKVA